MRCAVCGTDNAPDSKFCGGCGARVTVSNVAPTQKIADDVKWTDARPSVAPAPVGAYLSQPPQMPPPMAYGGGAAPYAPPMATPNGIGPAGSVRPIEPVRTAATRAATDPSVAPIAPITSVTSGARSTADASLGGLKPRMSGAAIAVLIVDVCLAAAGTGLLVLGLK